MKRKRGNSFILSFDIHNITMDNIKLSLFVLVAFGFVCTAYSNPITNLFGKSNDKAEADDKVTEAAAAAAAVTTTTTTTTSASPSSSCGGLKGFLHICEKTESTDPPKSVKTRSADDKDNSSDEGDSSDSDSDGDSEEDEKKKNENEDEKKIEENEDEKKEIKKREVEVTEEPPFSGEKEIPPEVYADPILKKRQTEEEEQEEKSTESSETEEDGKKRRRRECRDREGDEDKDCKRRRRKRELVPKVASKTPADATKEDMM